MEKSEMMKKFEAETGKEAIDYLTEYPFDDYTRWLEAKAAAYDRLMSALTSILTKAKEVENLSPSNVDWWCPNCGTTSCTYDGRCTKCGAEIEQFQVEPFKDSLHELIDGLLSVLPDGFESAIPSKVKSKDIPSREDA
jgi:rubrerythrin